LWFGVVRVGTGFHPYGSSLDGMKKKKLDPEQELEKYTKTEKA